MLVNLADNIKTRIASHVKLLTFEGLLSHYTIHFWSRIREDSGFLSAGTHLYTPREGEVWGMLRTLN
ncbi:hypothetical protein GCM10009861_02570 [Neomicrococcus aestuarii]